MTQTETIIVKLDKLLEDDNNFSTRTGLKFMTAVMRDALVVIGDMAVNKDSLNTKVKNLDEALTQFLQSQVAKENKAEAERTKWRWAIITPTLGVVILELARWILK